MKWQVKYALKNLNDSRLTANHVDGEVIDIAVSKQPNVLAVISEERRITTALAEQTIKDNPRIDFICGYRKECLWEGGAIELLQRNNIGWGNFGTLHSAALEGNANIAEHKIFAFASRLIGQYGIVESAVREYDRVFKLTLRNGKQLRIGMIPDYEPTSDNVRDFWKTFGPVDIAWNINPNGEPTQASKATGNELGCKVVKTEGMKELLQSW